jgi:hypothetical protein
MENLEQITKDTCQYKVQVMKLNYVSEELMKCRNCIGTYYVNCERYKPINKSQIPIKKGVIALYNFWYNNISIRGLNNV